MTLPKEVLEALENHPKANEKFIGTFTTYQEVVEYFPDWWEEEYKDWSVQEIVGSWTESCCLHVIPHHGELYVFGDLDY